MPSWLERPLPLPLLEKKLCNCMSDRQIQVSCVYLCACVRARARETGSRILTMSRRITFCQPPIMSAIHPSFYLILTCSAHLHIFRLLESTPVLKFFPEHIKNFVMTSSVNIKSPLKILIPNSRLVHSTPLAPAVILPLHICHSLMETLSPLTESELYELH